MTHYRAQPEDDAVLIVLCAVRDGQFGKSALNEVIDLWVAGQIGRTDGISGAVSREHAVQAIGWLSAEVAVHGAPSLGPEWLELWHRALTATGSSTGAVDERDRLREVLRAVLMEPDPIKRNQ